MNDKPCTAGGSGAGQGERRLLPLTVWLCSDVVASDSQEVKDVGRKPRLCGRHQQAVGRELARHLIETCTGPGGLVVDAFASSEAVLTAAAQLGRKSVACVPHFPLAQYVDARLRAGLSRAQRASVQLQPCYPERVHWALGGRVGMADLVIAAPPSYEVGPSPKLPGPQGCPSCRAEMREFNRRQMASFLEAASRALRPGGCMAVITAARYEGGRLSDPAPWIIRQCGSVGLRYIQHVIALRVPVSGDCLVVQAQPASFAELRRTDASALPPVVSVHADVHLFTKATRAGEAR